VAIWSIQNGSVAMTDNSATDCPILLNLGTTVLLAPKLSVIVDNILMLNSLVLSGLIVSEGLRKSLPNVTIFLLQNFSLNSRAYIYLLVKFVFCLFLFFHVYSPPVMVNKDVY